MGERKNKSGLIRIFMRETKQKLLLDDRESVRK